MKLLPAILLLFWNVILQAQSIISRFETIGVEDGLSQSSVYSIYQDKEGYMWFGTADGLNRYDGSEIKVFKIISGLATKGNSNFIRGKLCEDDKGNIWFSSETGIYFYDRILEQLRLAYTFPETRTGVLYYIMVSIDKNQNLWLINNSLGLALWQTRTGTMQYYSYPFGVDLTKIVLGELSVLDSSGGIWFNIHRHDGLYCFNIQNKQFEHFLPGKNYQVVGFGKGKSFLASGNKIYQYDSKMLPVDSISLFISQKEPVRIRNVFEDGYGRLWMATFNYGLLYYDYHQKRIYQYRHSEAVQRSLSSDFLTLLATDRSGNLWIGTDGGGVCKLNLNPPRFNLFPQNEGEFPVLKDNFTKCFFEDEQKRIWFGTLHGFSIYNPADGSIKHFSHHDNDPLSLPGNIVSYIFKDKDGSILIWHNMGISIFNEARQSFQTVPQVFWGDLNPGQLSCFRILPLKNGDLMAATSEQLVQIIKRNDKYFATSRIKGIEGIPTTITDLVELNKGNIWLASPLIGLYHYDFTNDTFSFKERFLSGIDFRSLHVDDTDPYVLWIASGKGLIRFDTRAKKSELFDDNKGMSNSYVYGILEDGKGNLWMSTNGGISRFSKETHQFQNYSWKDGLQSNEFNTGAFYKGASGTFYFGGIKGFNYFKPDDFENRSSEFKPGIAISQIKVNDKVYLQDSLFENERSLRLKYFNNDLFFQLAALDFTLPQANKVQYKLEGWDKDWVTSYNKKIIYSNLPAGTYTFKAKAANSDGVWSREENITIIITPPFWKTWWFYFLVVAGLIGSIIWATRIIAQRRLKIKIMELEKLQAIEAERSRISRDMHDEIGSGLTRIALMTELMKTQQGLNEHTRHDVSEIAGSSRTLVSTMSEIIWTLNPQNDKLDNLLAYLREQTQQYFEPFTINYRVNFPEIIPDVKLSNQQRRNLFLVSKEALNNALKHSGATTIELTVEIMKSKCSFQVLDNGKGIDKTNHRTGSNGLNNMKRRMENIQGGIEWLQENGRGTRVHYWIDL